VVISCGAAAAIRLAEQDAYVEKPSLWCCPICPNIINRRLFSLAFQQESSNNP
jgi:hypothetical protein